jgi:hypothetical protein
MHFVLRPNSQVDRVFRLAGIHEAMPVFPDRAGALAALPKGAARDLKRSG